VLDKKLQDEFFQLLYFALLKFEIPEYIKLWSMQWRIRWFCRSMEWKQVTKKLKLTLTSVPSKILTTVKTPK